MQDAMACYALTPKAFALAQRLVQRMPNANVHIFVPQELANKNDAAYVQGFHSLPMLVGQHFHAFQAHVFIGAVGIAVRCIAPHLEHKSVDPAVVVCDEGGSFAISVLSGHWGGGNALAERIAHDLGATPVITTATDTQGLPSIDMMAKESGCIILDWPKVKFVNGALLRGERICCYDVFDMLHMKECAHGSYFEHIACLEMHESDSALQKTMIVSVDWRQILEHEHLVRMTFPALCVGVGCKRGVSASDIVQAVQTCLTKAHVEPQALGCLASVDVKKDEHGLIEAAQMLGVPLYFFTPEELAEAPVLNPSTMAAQFFGIDGISVCEGAALLAAGGETPVMLMPKEKHLGSITVALAIHEKFLPPQVDLI